MQTRIRLSSKIFDVQDWRGARSLKTAIIGSLKNITQAYN